MWRNGARRSCETEYENASNSLLLRSSSTLNWARSSARRRTIPTMEFRNSRGRLDLAVAPGVRPEPDDLLPGLERLPGWIRPS